jgi:hypothetical protein
MNSISTIIESQALSPLLNEHGSLSHKQQLVSENRCERRLLNTLGQRLSGKQRANLRFKRSERFQSWKAIAAFYKSLTPAFDRLMAEVLKFGYTFDTIRVSAITLARRVGCCRDTVQEFLKELRRRGFLVLNRRRWNNSSERRLHPDFFNANLKMRFWKKFDAYRDYFQKANRYLKLFLIFQKDPTLELSTLNISRFSKDDIQLYERDIQPKGDTQSRDAIVTISEEKAVDLKELKAHPIFKSIPKQPLGNDPHVIAEKKRSALQAAPPLLKERVAPILRLGVKGLVKLTRYPEAALEYGITCLNRYGVRSTLTNFQLFESACSRYCHDRNIPVASDENEALLRQMGYVESQPCCKRLTLAVPIATTIAPHNPSPEATIIGESAVAPIKNQRKIVAPSEQIDISKFIWGKELESLALKLNYSHLISNKTVDFNK